MATESESGPESIREELLDAAAALPHDSAATDREHGAADEASADGATADETPVPGGFMAALSERLDPIEQSVHALRQTVDERLRYDDAKEAAFNRLYAELEEQKKRASGESLRPLLRDLVMLYDHIMDALGQHPDEAESLDLIRQSLLEVLYRMNVEPIECRLERYDRSLQQVRRVEKTVDLDSDWTVAQVLRDGFRFGDVILRPQQVVVRRYEGPAGGPREPADEKE
jgi:molecular chaperone GrpE (heat shock protein)